MIVKFTVSAIKNSEISKTEKKKKKMSRCRGLKIKV